MVGYSRWTFPLCLFLLWLVCGALFAAEQTPARFRLATFRADVTIPLGHRCMGVLPTKSTKIVDPLEVRGLVLLGGSNPIVIAVFDWCEIRNESYNGWRKALADVAGTRPDHVLVSCNHQHDAPVIDGGAAKLLAEVGLPNELFDQSFHQRMITRVTQTLRESLTHAVPVTRIGVGQAEVERIASSRRVVDAKGRVSFARGSRSGGNPLLRDAPEGTIDRRLKAITFWHDETPLAMLSCYATHPMSYYGRGEVSWDFVGMARERMQRDHPRVFQVYATGCSGDVTAGKYNTGSPQDRQLLAKRLHRGMVSAWKDTQRFPLEKIDVRVARLTLEFHPAPALTVEALKRQLRNEEATVESRILAAMGLSSRMRVASGEPIDVPCVDLGSAKIVLLPGEAFVAYQLAAQKLSPNALVMAIGYGECWPGYIPTEADFREGFRDKWLWVAPGSQQRIDQALGKVLK